MSGADGASPGDIWREDEGFDVRGMNEGGRVRPLLRVPRERLTAIHFRAG
jgi:hypothetical protein